MYINMQVCKDINYIIIVENCKFGKHTTCFEYNVCIVLETRTYCTCIVKTVTQAGDLLPEIKRRIALGWAAFSKVANIMKSRKASMNVKRKVHNEYVLPVMVYGSETWALKKAHMELRSVAQRKMERIMLGITLRDHKRNTWIRHQTGVNDIRRYQEGNTCDGGTHCTIQRQQMDKKSDRVDTTRMDKTAGKT